MLNFLAQLFREVRPTCYGVSKNGGLVLDREALLKSGRMQRQFDAAQSLHRQAVLRVAPSSRAP